jgi:hypothetical protein
MSMLIVVVFFWYNIFIFNAHILNGRVVRALGLKANEHSSILTKVLIKNLFAWEYLTLLWSKYLLTQPPPPPPAVAVEISRQSCRNLKSKKTEGGEYSQLVEVSVNSKEENS